MPQAYIGMGGNLGDVRSAFRAAEAALRARPDVARTRASPLYRTAPVGGPPQPEYLNACLEVTFSRRPDPLKFLEHLQRIEGNLGRRRETEARLGPRPIDLDLLLFGDEILELPGLTVPHPRLARRAFALVPLCDLLGPGARLPGGVEGTLAELARKAQLDPAQKISKVE